MLSFLHDAEAAIIGTEPITAEVLDALPELRLIVKYGVGLDNLNLEYAYKKGVQVAWQSGLNRRSVAELALCFLLGLARNVFFSFNCLKQGQWLKRGGQQLSEKTIGIIGCGHTGSELIELLAPFNCRILINDIVDKSSFIERQRERGTHIRALSKQQLYAASDFVSLHLPLTSESYRMIDSSALRSFKAGAYLINLSRGEIVDQEALKGALQKRIIAGAALDVFAEEPLQDRQLLSLPNLIVTPHIGGNAQEAVLAMGRAAIEQLQQYRINR